VTNQEILPIRRFLQTLDVVRREGEHLYMENPNSFAEDLMLAPSE